MIPYFNPYLIIFQDLELTVHIGKELLSQNTQLEKRIIELESELRNANESIHQLSHELVQKTELINILTESEETLSETGKLLYLTTTPIETDQKKIYSIFSCSIFIHNSQHRTDTAEDQCP